MLILRLFRYLLGYVRFDAWGGFPERFINLCEHNRILLWDVRSRDGVITACTDRSGYKRMRCAARRSGMRLRIKKKCGLPFFLNRHSRRVGIIIGMCICVSSLLILSTRLWSIEVTGNDRVPSEEIIAAFEQAGVRLGTACEKIDEDAAEEEAMKHLSGILWININVRGSSAFIEVRETTEQPTLESDEPGNIVAAEDGQIVILRPFNGTQEQKIGNSVLKGELLISGMEENKDLTVSFCRADGYVVARTAKSFSASCPAEFSAERVTKAKRSFRLNFLTLSVPLTPPAGEGAYAEQKRLRLNGVTMPVGVTVSTVQEKAPADISLSESRAQLVAQLGFLERCADEFRYIYAESAETNMRSDGGGCSVEGSFTCLENIGASEPMEIEQGQKEAGSPQ